MVKLSIIIPVYKVEEYLNRCVDSILCQDTSNCEILLIDDGSPDRCGEICEEYSEKYNNVSTLHKANGGLSDARNYGISRAKGEYIWFIDSDDYIEDNCIQTIIERLEEYKCDVLVCQSRTVDDNGKTENEVNYSIESGLYTSEGYMEALNQNPKSIIFCAQYHICRTKFLLDNKFEFYKGIIHEDELWTPQLLLKAESIYYSGLNVYYHYMREGSIMHSDKLERSGECDLLVTKKLFDIYDKTKRSDLIYLRDHAADTFLQAIWKIPGFLERKERIERALPLKNSRYLKTRLKAVLYFVSPRLYLKLHNIKSN